MVRFEEAKRCPKCDTPGEDTGGPRRADGSKVHIIFCRNTNCSWNDSSWIVQVMSNGEIPERKTGDKQFTPLTESQRQHGRDYERYMQEVFTHGEIAKP